MSNGIAQLRTAVHRVADAAIDAADALTERGLGERLAATIAALEHAVARVRDLHDRLATRAPNDA